MLKVQRHVTPKSLMIAAAAINAATQLNAEWDVIITHGMDGQHMEGSLHYEGAAIDLRISNIPQHMRASYIATLKARLGTKFDVVRESDHIHVEFDP